MIFMIFMIKVMFLSDIHDISNSNVIVNDMSHEHDDKYEKLYTGGIPRSVVDYILLNRVNK